MSPLQNTQHNGPIHTLLTVNHHSTSSDIYPSPNAPVEPYSAPRDMGKQPVIHSIRLSGLEHTMPRAYIRVCLGYRASAPEIVDKGVRDLKAFVRRIVDAKPYLAGYVVPARDPDHQVGKVEIQFTDQDFLEFNPLQIRHYTAEEMPYEYDELDRLGLPPSIIRPELVSALPEGADEDRAPVLRVQANLVKGGIIVSFYLHHCISDGTGLALLLSGSVLKDDFAFERHLHVDGLPTPSLTERLATFANKKSCARAEWSWSSPNQISTRQIAHKYFTPTRDVPEPKNPPGRGCIFTFPCKSFQKMKDSLTDLLNNSQRASLAALGTGLSKSNTLMAVLWHYMTRARASSLISIYAVTKSKLLIPVNIRSKIKPPLSDHYFGSAVDFTSVELSLQHLLHIDHRSMASTAFAIRQAISKVDDEYIRSSIALATSNDRTIDVRDLQASNMNRVTGADMYITSWEQLGLYTSELGMKLGYPDWIRKPWSRDPGSCIVLPRDARKDHLEVVVQMTEEDMARLLNDQEFMSLVSRVIE